DSFDIDYVAHEMGHQFGASHTFNGATGSCTKAREATSAYEPGSGSTIMAYANLCDVENLQKYSDDYFHSRSLDQINSFVAGAGACSVNVPNGNSSPSVNAG